MTSGLDVITVTFHDTFGECALKTYLHLHYYADNSKK